MKVFKSKITLIVITILCIFLLFIGANFLSNIIYKNRPIAVKSKGKLESLYEGHENSFLYDAMFILSFPYNILSSSSFSLPSESVWYDTSYPQGTMGIDSLSGSTGSSYNSHSNSTPSDGSNLEFSTTNVQVENVDEADIIKTDGNYIYSLSESNVIITDVTDKENPKEVNKIENSTSSVPVDLLLYNNMLVVIMEDATKSSYNRTVSVTVYDISNKENINQVKNIELNQRYYSSRLIDGHLYLIANGSLKEDSDDNIETFYKENYEIKAINLKNMYYFKDRPSIYETEIVHMDLNVIDNDIEVQSFLSDVDSIYVSEKNIYMADGYYSSTALSQTLSTLLSLKGVWGFLDEDLYDYSYKTSIIKLGIQDDYSVKFVAKNDIEGETIDQFSFDEYNNNLRVAIQNSDDGSKIVVFNEKMKLIGETGYVGKNEDMYSSRFIGDRAYLVTYMNTDPLFTFDLSNPKKPKILGELKIPGYSTYLHPYDENHLIGIGINTEERVSRNSYGQVIGTNVYVTGMKMALFDVSNLKNPTLVSEVAIGDSRTKSAILDNHKALLFSKEKQLIAIPVTSYPKDLEDEQISGDETVDKVIKAYKTSSDYISEGYLVYNINLEDGITQKGTITHNSDSKYSYRNSQMLRGLYINDYLYTVSQHMVKVNKLDTLENVNELAI